MFIKIHLEGIIDKNRNIVNYINLLKLKWDVECGGKDRRVYKN